MFIQENPTRKFNGLDGKFVCIFDFEHREPHVCDTFTNLEDETFFFRSFVAR